MKTTTLNRILTTIMLALVPALAPAANLTWDANTALTGAQDGSGIWDNTAANWWTGSANAAFNNATPDVPTFGAANGVAGTVTLGANIISGNIAFNASSVGYYTIAGGANTLGLTNGTIAANVNATISANIVGTGVTLGNSIANAPIGTLTLSGNNSYTSFTLGANAANVTSSVRPATGTALGTGTIFFNNQGNQTSPRIELVGGITIANPVTFNGRNNPTEGFVAVSGANTLSGTISGSTGGQNYRFRSESANGLTFSAPTALSLNTSGTRNWVLDGSGSGTVSGVIAGGAVTATIVKAGSGAWTLSGANSYAGNATVGAGTLTLDYSSQNQNNSKLPDAGVLTLAGGTLSLNGGSHPEVVGSTTIAPGSSSVTRSSGTSTLRLNAITRNRGGVIDFAAPGIADTDTANVNGILGGGYATVAGADWAVNSTGAGDGPITAYTAYTDIPAGGGTIVDGPTSNVRLTGSTGSGGVHLAAAMTTIQTLLQNSADGIFLLVIDPAGQTLRLGTNGAVLVPSGKQDLIIGDDSGASPKPGTLTAGGSDNTAGEIIFTSFGPYIEVGSVIADNGTGPVSVTVAGSGQVNFLGGNPTAPNNTYTGTNTIAGGTLSVSSDACLGASPGVATPGQIVINGGTLNAMASFTLNANRGVFLGSAGANGYNGGTISVDIGRTLTYNGIIAGGTVNGSGGFTMTVGPGSLTKTGDGTLVLGGANTYAGGTIINGGTLSIIASGNLGVQPGCYIPDHLVVNGGTLEATASLTLGNPRGIMLGPVGGFGGGAFQVDGGVTLQLDSRIADNWNGTGVLAKTGPGTLILTSPCNDYSGDTLIDTGVLQVNNSRAIPNGGGKGNIRVIGTATLNINGVNVAINGLDGDGPVDNIGSSAITFEVGNNDQTSSFGGSIRNTGGALTLKKVGNGRFTFTGGGDYSGSTLVTAGTLALASSATIGSTTNIAVSAGATFDVSRLYYVFYLSSGQTLSGNGTVLGAINLEFGTLAPGASAGTLTVQNLTLNGSTLNYDLANVTTIGSGVNDYTIVSGLLNVAGPVALNLNYLNGLPAGSGKYTLLSYGSFAGDVNNISVPAGFTINNNTVAKTIELLINHTPAILTWRGDGSSDVWDIDITPNWIQAGSPVTFFNGDTANFDSTGSNSPPIFVSTPVIAGAVNVNASQTYDFTGSSILAATFSKGGSGTWILENDNTYPSGGIISGGPLQIGNGGTTGSLTGGNITNNGALVANSAGDIVLGSAISGSGTLSQVGTGSSALTASNSYAGATLVSSGRLYARNTFAFGDTNTGTTVASGAQIYIDANVNIAAEPLILNGSGLNSTGDGALRKGAAGVTAFAGPITLGSDTTINVDGNATLNLTNANGITSSGANLILTGGGGSQGTVSGPINLGGGGGILTKTGSGSWTLGSANSMSLATIDDGVLVLANNNALGTNLNVVLTSTTGGAGLSGTRLTLSGGVSIPANRSLTMPSSGAGTIRSAFVGTGAGLTNTWAGPVTLTGDSAGSGNVIAFGVDANSTFVLGGNVTADSTFLGGKLLIRGNATGVGYFLGSVGLDPANGQIQVDDGSTWVFASSANTWATTIFAGNGTVRLGVNNALPTSSVLALGNNNANRLDLAGFNQQLAGMDAAGINITNSSVSADSTLTYSSVGISTFGGTIRDGTRKLNLTIASGNLTLTNAATLNLTKSTVSVAGGGAVLEMDFVGTNIVNGLVLNGTSQPAGLYNILNSAPYLTGVGNILVQPGPTAPATLTNSVSGNTLSLSWPAGQGWRLQGLTNSAGINNISNNWSTAAGASDGSFSVPIVTNNPPVFYRLVYP